MAKFFGTEKEFNDFIGPRISSVVNSIAVSARHACNKTCRRCKTTNVELQSAHVQGKDKKTIVNQVLQKYKAENDYYSVDIQQFEDELKKAHYPIKETFLFLCKDCHKRYNNIENNKEKKSEVKIPNSLPSEMAIDFPQKLGIVKLTPLKPQTNLIQNEQSLSFSLEKPEVKKRANKIEGRIATGKNILCMEKGDIITNFYDLIVNSKKECSRNWAGKAYMIKNTPQQGINWIGGDDYELKAVIIKSIEGKYEKDIHGKSYVSYAFKKRNGYVNKEEKANMVIVNQKEYNYPILYFIKNEIGYTLFGKFSVDEIVGDYFTLIPFKD